MTTEQNVKVAVRVRPFNKREISRKSKCIVSMNGPSTTILNPEDANDKRTFTFDHSYWSFDGFKTDQDEYCLPDLQDPNGGKFSDQNKVFSELGEGILENAWEGYNTSLFAYGQTGSGKSWSIIGYGANKGIVPIFCAKLFEGIKKMEGSGSKFEVKFSMLEIYNEVTRDLLQPQSQQKKNGLKIRQHPKKGFYAEGLTEVMVANYEHIANKMEEGTINRTVASTNMNATSSRAHTIVGIHFIQKKKNKGGKEMAKGALINLVDLAGSERVDATGATGDRLKEGAAINQSLSCLGNVIHALAETTEGKHVIVPFRDSPLTKLLQNALGGNSKTIMIAAISPADINYDESLSTLRYADRAKQIRTTASVNEDPTETLIRELKQQNEKLRAQLANGKVDLTDIQELRNDVSIENLSKDEIEKLKGEWQEEMMANMRDNNKELEEMRLSYEEKLRSTISPADALRAQIMEDKKSKTHLYNLNFDPQLSGRIIHIIQKPITEIGNRKGNESDVCMVGPGIHNQHAVISRNERKNKVSIKPFEKDCRILVNGTSITGDTDLEHNDRLVFGSTHIWVYQNPQESGIESKKYPPITYEFAQEEIASKAGINVDHSASTDVAMLQDDLIEVMPAVEEANSISEELDKRVKFEIILISPNMIGKRHSSKAEGFADMQSSQPEVCVKMKNLENGTEFIWPKEKFLNRLYLMKEMYNNYEEEEDDWDLPEEKDPFQEDLNQEVHIGTTHVFLQPVAYMVEMKEQLEITDLKGNKIGIMNIEVAPCDSNGKEYSEDDDKFVDSPEELIGKEINFLFKIINCRGLPNKYKDVHCLYKMYLDESYNQTSMISFKSNPDFNYTKNFNFPTATAQLINYLNRESVSVRIMGKQHIRKSALDHSKGLSTKDLIQSDRSVFSKTTTFNVNNMGRSSMDPQKQSIIVELLLMKKTQKRLQQKNDNIKKDVGKGRIHGAAKNLC
nr:kinesin-like protein KIF28P isoform X1 [Lepeophtheirus salmonis]XP_040578231.1 kinesin-like protein KIF28P isoform X1 [Lepeophtheirus salmonis]XP_040578235.1 kinesin-like protein KIF28P isoform X1 [Lepeophtheirus salmonis]